MSPLERKTATIVGEGSGLTGRSVQRYIRLIELIPGLLEMVDTAPGYLIDGDKPDMDEDIMHVVNILQDMPEGLRKVAVEQVKALSRLEILAK